MYIHIVAPASLGRRKQHMRLKIYSYNLPVPKFCALVHLTPAYNIMYHSEHY